MKRLLVFALLIIGLTGCAGTVTTTETPAAKPSVKTPNLRDRGPAPELTNEVWLNTEGPLRLADLRGKVVLLEMWTYG